MDPKSQDDAQRRLKTFLRLGFFLDSKPSIDFDLSRVDPARYQDADDAEMIQRIDSLFRTAVLGRFEPRRRHVVPLSGGLDSRAILAVLLEATDAANLETTTFGSPGSYDFELGAALARHFGTKHSALPLTSARYDTAELLDTSRRIRHQTVLFHHPRFSDWQERFNDHLIWSGFLGDKLAKGPAAIVSDERARANFLAENTYVRSERLAVDSVEELNVALAIPEASRSRLLLEEDLNLRFRQARFVAPHVLAEGFSYVTPFLDPPLMEYMLSLPLEKRKGGRLYRRFLAASFPQAFAIGTKANEGLPLSAAAWRVEARRMQRRIVRRVPALGRRIQDPTINYLDFARAIRERSDLRGIVRESIHDLEQRQLIESVDVGQLLQRHLLGERDHSDALLVLTSLEIHLKAGLDLSKPAGEFGG